MRRALVAGFQDPSSIRQSGPVPLPPAAAGRRLKAVLSVPCQLFATNLRPASHCYFIYGYLENLTVPLVCRSKISVNLPHDKGDRYFRGGLEGRISTQLGKQRGSWCNKSITTRATSSGASFQDASASAECPPKSVLTLPGIT